jgi:N-acetyl-anhydromuramyl-L-alanine amidase AmpD
MLTYTDPDGNVFDLPPVVSITLTPNQEPRPKGITPIAVVIHAMQGFLTGTDAEFLKNGTPKSSHYATGQLNGKWIIRQYADEAQKTWHTGLPSQCYTNRALYPKWPLYRHGSNPNDYTIGIENEGFGVDTTYGATTFKATTFNAFQYFANAWIVAQAAKRWGFPIDSQHVIEHGDVYVAKHGVCPGSLCDISRIIEQAQDISDMLAL